MKQAAITIILAGCLSALLAVGCSRDENPVLPHNQDNPKDVVDLIMAAGEPADKNINAGVDTIDVSKLSEDVRGDSVWQCRSFTLNAGFDAEAYPLFDPNAEVIWPGAALQGATLDEAPPERIIAPRGPGKIVVNNISGTAVSSVAVEEATMSSSLRAANLIVDSLPDRFPARFLFDYRQIRTKSELAILLEANSSFFGLFSMKSRFEFEENSDKTVFLVTLHQSFYTLMFERPNDLGKFFAPSVTAANLQQYIGPGNPPVYVSSVTYGRIFYLLIESSELRERMIAAISASFFGTGINAQTKYIKDLKNLRIQAFALGGDAQQVLDIVTDPVTESLRIFVRNLSSSGNIRTAVPLSYVARSVRSDKLVKNADALTYNIRDCSLGLIRKTITVPSFSTGTLWPTPKSGCGCDFETHKPDVHITAGLDIVDKRVLHGKVTMYIKDRSPDCTEGNLSATFSLYAAPTGFRIIKIIDPAPCDFWYWDNDMIEQLHLEYCGLGEANILAETVNEDLCDASLNDRTRMTFKFKEIRLEIEKQIAGQ